MVDLISEINGSNCSETGSLLQSPLKLITQNSRIVLTGVHNKLECGNLQCYPPYHWHLRQCLIKFCHLFDNFHIRWLIGKPRRMGGVIGIYRWLFAAGLTCTLFSIPSHLFADSLTESRGWANFKILVSFPFWYIFLKFTGTFTINCPLDIYFCSWCLIAAKHQRWNIRHLSFFAYDVQGQNIRPASRRAQWTSNISRRSCESTYVGKGIKRYDESNTDLRAQRSHFVIPKVDQTVSEYVECCRLMNPSIYGSEIRQRLLLGSLALG